MLLNAFLEILASDISGLSKEQLSYLFLCREQLMLSWANMTGVKTCLNS